MRSDNNINQTSSLRDEIQRIRANSSGLNADLKEVQQNEIETKRIEGVRVDIELKNLVKRIKGVTGLIKDKVKK
jgi:hypothetical protein